MSKCNLSSIVKWGRSETAWETYSGFLKDIVYRNSVTSVCDIGGGANPLLSIAEIGAQGATYSILDISKTELEKAPNGYNKILADAASTDFKIESKFDLVFSKMLMEHVTNSEQFHRNVFSILNDGGIAVHFFPTLYAMPFAVNRLLSERAGKFLLDRVAPRDSYQHAKFPAYYDWCRGPTSMQVRNYQRLGYHVVHYAGFFGHGYYKKLKLLDSIQNRLSAFLVKHPISLLTSYAYLVLQKPLCSQSELASGNRTALSLPDIIDER